MLLKLKGRRTSLRIRRFWKERGKGEKVGEEPTAPGVSLEARKTPSGARPNRGPRSGPLQFPQRGMGPGYWLLRQMILSPALSKIIEPHDCPGCRGMHERPGSRYF